MFTSINDITQSSINSLTKAFLKNKLSEASYSFLDDDADVPFQTQVFNAVSNEAMISVLQQSLNEAPGLPKNVEIFCTLQVEALHNWANCDIEEVMYLKHPHRHIFYIKAFKRVTHNDRDIEFIKLKHEITEYLRFNYWDESQRIHNFGSQSCEMIAADLYDTFNLSSCNVSEDNENGSIVY
jgi:hypothetical protein